MGIRGLMSFVEDYSNEFFTDLKLRDTKIIIDGYSLFHRLCFNSNLELRYGGDYDSFANVVQKFFESLFACHICPYVVLDGGCDISDKKLTTLKDRAREKIQAAHSLSVGGGGNVCPLLIREVFIQVLIRLKVCFVQSFSEADRDIMTLANHWNCPVLSSDSDFCIFDLKSGFCPLNSFQWRNLNTVNNTQDYYIPAKCFSLDAFCHYFSNLNKSLLPLFAVLCGNDHVNLPIIETFLSKARLPVSSKGRRYHRVQGLLNWLSHFDGPAEALDNVLKYLPKKGREDVKKLLYCSMEEYQPSQVKLQDFFCYGTYVCPDTLNLDLPEWVLVALAKGQLPPFISDALVLQRTFLHTQVENMQRPNAHRIAQPIRQIIYGLLLNASSNPENMSQKTVPSQPLAFNEVERISKNIKTSVVYAKQLLKDHSDLSKLIELPLARRQILLLEALKVNQVVLESIPALLKLPIAVTCYWLQSTEAKAKLCHLQALLLGMLMEPLQAIINCSGEEDPQAGGASMLYEELQRVKVPMRPSARLDLDTAHVFCQWQCCLQMGLYLNQLLSTPLPEPDLTQLYSGSLVHGLCQQLVASTSAESLLNMCPKAKQLYEHLFNATRSYAPAELFLPKAQSNSKKRRQKKKVANQSKNKVVTTSDTRQWYDRNNRFGLLMVEPPPSAPFGCPPPPLPSPAFPPPLPQRPGPFPGASAPFLQPPLALQPRAPAEASRGGGGSSGSFFPVPPPPLPPPPPQCRPFPGPDAGERPRPPPPGPGPPWSPRWAEAPPPPDVLGDAALQRLRDRQWLEAVFGNPRRPGGPGPPRTPVGPSLGEVRARLRAALRLVRRLRSLGQSLREAETDGAAWASLHAQAVPLRAELAERLQPLAQAAYVGEARRRLKRVRRRRLRLRERAREREAEREAEAAQATEREQEIDRWRVKCVQEVEEKKREQELKAAADGVLSEVRKKQSDTKRMVDILRALEKLRKLRKEAAARKGVCPPASADETFEHHLQRLRKLIKKRSELYEAEERALRVMLEGEQEEERKRELEKKQRKEKEKLLLQKREIESKLFGDPDEFPLAHLLQPFRQYYLQAEHSLPALIQIRHDWDQYLVPSDHPKGNSVPQGWVLPPIPSNDIWATAVKLH